VIPMFKGFNCILVKVSIITSAVEKLDEKGQRPVEN
jgi:hypothetical protein